MRSLFRSTSLHRLFAALAICATIPLATAATRAAIPASGVAHGTTVHLTAPAAASTRTTSSAPASFFFTPNSQWATEAQNTRLSSIATLVASGFLDVYTGAQPANANSTVTGTLLCSIAIGATPFTTPASGAMSNASTWSCTAGATGTAGYYVLYKSNHTSVELMGSVGTSGANLNLATTAISSGVTVSIASGGYVINDNATISGQ